MSDLFWPGDDRAGDHFSQHAFVAAMVSVEQQWLDLLIAHGIAPPAAGHTLGVDPGRHEWLARESELTGTPVSGLLSLLRDHPDTPPETARWMHRGLTSQDVVDTALSLLSRAAVAEVSMSLRAQISVASDHVRVHRETPMIGRTLTQHAIPVTFGLFAASWLTGILDAYDQLRQLRFPLQVGGAAGTLAAIVELGVTDPRAMVAELAGRLDLDDAPPWHTSRSPMTRLGDALVGCTDAWGRLANDVLTLGRPEIGEVVDGSGGGSSTMPQKRNPVLAILVKRASLTTPALASTLHLAAVLSAEQRSDGGWHAEWAALRDLARRTVTAGSQTTELLTGLEVHPGRMAATLAAGLEDSRAEQRSMSALTGRSPAADYRGISLELVDATLTRAAEALQ